MGHAPCTSENNSAASSARELFSMLMLSDFSVRRPERTIAQRRALQWLIELHASAEATLKALSPSERAQFASRYAKLVERVACCPDKISARGHVTSDIDAEDASEAQRLYDPENPHGRGTKARMQLFAQVVNAYFEREFAAESVPPSELIHVTCTGYLAPSGAQRLVALRGWGARTHVTHAYHMGCYAAFPALRMAAGHLAVPDALRPLNTRPRVDVVHTELCSLHLDPSDHSAEQCVVQSLFADGFIRYSVGRDAVGPGLELLALSEQILPDSTACMAWEVGDFGMHMTLTRDVPERIATALRPFIMDLFSKADLSVSNELKGCVVAVHPGGPKIIDQVGEVLELEAKQVQASRDVLFQYGNMSSATLPHVWQRVVEDARVAPGTLVLSLAFGPGLSVCGGLFRKH